MDRIGGRPDRSGFATCVFLGKDIPAMLEEPPAADRTPLAELEGYLSGDDRKVCILYGVRGSGISTMIGQALRSMSAEDLSRTALMDVGDIVGMDAVYSDLERLEDGGYRYIIISEITAVDGFPERCGALATAFASSGMRIVLAGTDTLAFRMACDDGLFGRAVTIHLDPVPFREHDRIYPGDGIDGYLTDGGTMKGPGGSPFAPSNLYRFIDLAVGRNISRSLDRAGYASKGDLESLRSSGGVEGAVETVLECIDRMLLPNALNEVWRSHYPGGMEDEGTTIAAGLDREAAMAALRRVWYSSDSDYAKLSGDADTLLDHLEDLDIVAGCVEEEFRDGIWSTVGRHLTAMPGLRLGLARPRLDDLMAEVPFSKLSESRKRACAGRIDEAVREILLTDEVFLETAATAGSGVAVRRLRFKDGAVDMMVYDEGSDSCILVDVEYTDRRMKDQSRHIADKAKNDAVAARFGRISRRIVMYLGEPGTVDGIKYVDVSAYLRGLPGSAKRLLSSL